MPANVEPEHRAAQKCRLDERGADDVLDHVGQPGLLEQFPDGLDQAGMIAVAELGVRLARRRRMDRVELLQLPAAPVGTESLDEQERVCLDELEWVVRLRPDVDTEDV